MPLFLAGAENTCEVGPITEVRKIYDRRTVRAAQKPRLSGGAGVGLGTVVLVLLIAYLLGVLPHR